MRVVNAFTTVLTMAACICAALAAQQSTRIESMKLLAPGKGWAATSAQLFWTSDGGNNWDDITPKHAPSQIIKDVFFLDASSGWVLFEAYDGKLEEHFFLLARTSDSGHSWLVTEVQIPSQTPEELTGDGSLSFADPNHGWVLLTGSSSSAFSRGLLLSTQDGGKGWTEVAGAPMAGRPVFMTSHEGWIYGNAAGGGVYSTHDGGRAWRAAGPSLAGLAPGLPTSPFYEDLGFAGAKRCFLLVRLQPATDEEAGAIFALYSTEDGGQHWTRDRALLDRSARLGAGTVRDDSPSSEWALMAASTDRARPGSVKLFSVTHEGLTDVGQASAVTGANVPQRPEDGIVSLSFSDKAHGWAATRSGLLLTVDGGTTWKNISPLKRSGPARLPTPSHPQARAARSDAQRCAAVLCGGLRLQLGFRPQQRPRVERNANLVQEQPIL